MINPPPCEQVQAPFVLPSPGYDIDGCSVLYCPRPRIGLGVLHRARHRGWARVIVYDTGATFFFFFWRLISYLRRRGGGRVLVCALGLAEVKYPGMDKVSKRITARTQEGIYMYV